MSVGGGVAIAKRWGQSKRPSIDKRTSSVVLRKTQCPPATKRGRALRTLARGDPGTAQSRPRSRRPSASAPRPEAPPSPCLSCWSRFILTAAWQTFKGSRAPSRVWGQGHWTLPEAVMSAFQGFACHLVFVRGSFCPRTLGTGRMSPTSGRPAGPFARQRGCARPQKARARWSSTGKNLSCADGRDKLQKNHIPTVHLLFFNCRYKHSESRNAGRRARRPAAEVPSRSRGGRARISHF